MSGHNQQKDENKLTAVAISAYSYAFHDPWVGTDSPGPGEAVVQVAKDSLMFMIFFLFSSARKSPRFPRFNAFHSKFNTC